MPLVYGNRSRCVIEGFRLVVYENFDLLGY